MDRGNGAVSRWVQDKWCLSIILAVFTACSPVIRTTSKNSTQSSDNASRPASQASELKLSLPAWCSSKQTGNQVCFRCERVDDSVIIPYEQCFDASDSFDASIDCSFKDDTTKTIYCDGTESGRSFVMDVSTAKEKVSTVLPTVLLAIELVFKDRFADNPQAATIARELSSFFSGRTASIVNGRDATNIATDLMLFVNRHIKTPMTAQQANHFKTTAEAALQQISRELSGHKDYSLTMIILRLLAVARTIPEEHKGDIKNYLTGAGLGDLLNEDRSQTLIRSLSILNPSILGVKSAQDLIAELQITP
jgi:hypothetical protein